MLKCGRTSKTFTLRERSLSLKTIYDSVYVKRPEKLNPQRQKENRRLPGAGESLETESRPMPARGCGGGGVWLLMGTGSPFKVTKMFWN